MEMNYVVIKGMVELKLNLMFVFIILHFIHIHNLLEIPIKKEHEIIFLLFVVN